VQVHRAKKNKPGGNGCGNIVLTDFLGEVYHSSDTAIIQFRKNKGVNE